MLVYGWVGNYGLEGKLLVRIPVMIELLGTELWGWWNCRMVVSDSYYKVWVDLWDDIYKSHK